MIRFENPPLELNGSDRKTYNYLYQVAERLNLLVDEVENGLYASGEESAQGKIGNTNLTLTDLAEMLQKGSTVGGANVYSLIKQTQDQIQLKVSKGSVIAEINLSSEAATISASKINLQGYVTMTDLATSGSTVINGANITTGTINCDKLYVSGQSIGTSSSSLTNIYATNGYMNNITLSGYSGSLAYTAVLNGQGITLTPEGMSPTTKTWATIMAGQTAVFG